MEGLGQPENGGNGIDILRHRESRFGRRMAARVVAGDLCSTTIGWCDRRVYAQWTHQSMWEKKAARLRRH